MNLNMKFNMVPILGLYRGVKLSFQNATIPWLLVTNYWPMLTIWVRWKQ